MKQKEEDVCVQEAEMITELSTSQILGFTEIITEPIVTVNERSTDSQRVEIQHEVVEVSH